MMSLGGGLVPELEVGWADCEDDAADEVGEEEEEGESNKAAEDGPSELDDDGQGTSG